MSCQKPKDNCGIEKTSNHGLSRLKKTNGWIIRRKLLSRFFQPMPVSHHSARLYPFAIGANLDAVPIALLRSNFSTVTVDDRQ
jgi:hypothetical protein